VRTTPPAVIGRGFLMVSTCSSVQVSRDTDRERTEADHAERRPTVVSPSTAPFAHGGSSVGPASTVRPHRHAVPPVGNDGTPTCPRLARGMVQPKSQGRTVPRPREPRNSTVGARPPETGTASPRGLCPRPAPSPPRQVRRRRRSSWAGPLSPIGTARRRLIDWSGVSLGSGARRGVGGRDFRYRCEWNYGEPSARDRWGAARPALKERYGECTVPAGSRWRSI
jgi:hypothetical protein